MRKSTYSVVAAVLLAGLAGPCGCSLIVPHSHQPRPAEFVRIGVRADEGTLIPMMLQPKNIYGMGLTYATHIKETGSRFNPNEPPPVFRKKLSSLNTDERPVRVPSRQELIKCAESVEPGLGAKLEKDFAELPPLLDYEGELGFVLLEDIDWQNIHDSRYAPAIGYFIANDLSARTIAVLGEGRENRYEFWGASKSFAGFLPVGRKVWVPRAHRPDAVFSTDIVTKVNGEVRQRQTTTDMIYTPRQMLVFISQKFPDTLPRKGDVVLTGTPSGVALQVPAWKARMADILGFDRMTKLTFTINSARNNKKFLKPGDVVEVSGGFLGEVKTEIVKPEN